MKKYLTSLSLLLSLFFFHNAALADLDHSKKSADQFPSVVASTWFELLYDVVKAEKTSPTAAARVYGIAAVALYESIVAGSEENLPLDGQLNGLSSVPRPKKNQKLHWPTVANTALANIIRGLYPSLSAPSLLAVNNLEQSFASQYAGQVGRPEYDRSVAYGREVAAAILAWAATDGYAQYNNCPYVPTPVAGAWKPTPPNFNPNPLQPCWGQLRPMALTSGQECPPLNPFPSFSTDPASDFFAAGFEVFSIGQGLTTEQKVIADFWADNPGATGTPPGHWIAIVSQLARNDGLSLTQAAEAYARVGIAVHDAFIVCWNGKYAFNLQRPVTYIQENIDPSWQPYIVTPNFPTFTSGHSTQSAAAARVLTHMFGVRPFTDTTRSDHGLQPALPSRSFASFEEAAAEAAVSRLYGGIHFSFDNNEGLNCGRCIGDAIQQRVSFR